MQEEKNLSHEDFKSGIAQGTIRFNIVDQAEFSKLVYQPYINFIGIIFGFLDVALIIIIPVLCLIFNKWILLLGFVGCIFGYVVHRICISPHTTKSRIRRSILSIISFTLLTTAMIHYLGMLNPISIIFACALYEFLSFNINATLVAELAINNLVKNADTYHYSIENNLIKIFRG